MRKDDPLYPMISLAPSAQPLERPAGPPWRGEPQDAVLVEQKQKPRPLSRFHSRPPPATTNQEAVGPGPAAGQSCQVNPPYSKGL